MNRSELEDILSDTLDYISNFTDIYHHNSFNAFNSNCNSQVQNRLSDSTVLLTFKGCYILIEYHM